MLTEFLSKLSPKTVTFPELAVINPKAILTNVLFPAPFGPKMPIFPFGISTEKSSSAVTDPYFLITFLASISSNPLVNISNLYL